MGIDNFFLSLLKLVKFLSMGTLNNFSKINYSQQHNLRNLMEVMPDHSDLGYKDSYFEKPLEETGEVPDSVSY